MPGICLKSQNGRSDSPPALVLEMKPVGPRRGPGPAPRHTVSQLVEEPRPEPHPRQLPLGRKHSPDARASPAQPLANLATASVPGPSVCPSCFPRAPLFTLSRAYRKQAGKEPCPRETCPQKLPPAQGCGHWDLQLPRMPAGNCSCPGPQFPHLYHRR